MRRMNTNFNDSLLSQNNITQLDIANMLKMRSNSQVNVDLANTSIIEIPRQVDDDYFLLSQNP